MPLLTKILIEWLPPEKIEYTSEAEETKTENEEVQDVFWQNMNSVDDIDTEIGLHRLNGLKEMYSSNLKLFHEKLKESCDKMAHYIANGDIKNFSITVHSMKSALASVGAESLANMAFRLETASKNEDSEYCTKEFPGFLERLKRLHEQLSAVFPVVEAVLEKTQGSAAHLRESIEKALEAVDDYDIDTGIEILSGLAAYDFGGEVNGLLESALAALKQYNYDGARNFLLSVKEAPGN